MQLRVETVVCKITHFIQREFPNEIKPFSHRAIGFIVYYDIIFY